VQVENAKTQVYQSIISIAAESGKAAKPTLDSAETAESRDKTTTRSAVPRIVSSSDDPAGARENKALSDATVANILALQESQGSTPIDEAILRDLEQYAIKNPTQEMMESGWRLATEIYIKPNIPSQGAYAEIKTGGRVIARIDNSGAVESDNSVGAQLQGLLRNETSDGPQLAEERARKIAQAFGGTVEYATSAKTQQEWHNRPPVTWSIDVEAMRQNGYDLPPNFSHRDFSSSRLASEALMTLRETQGV